MAFDDIIDEEEEQLSQQQEFVTTRKLRLKNPVNTQGMLNKIKSALYMSINYYWKDLSKPDILLSSLLDPRMKELSFVTSEKCNDTKNLLHEKYNEMQNSTIQPTIQSTKSPVKKKKHTILASLKKSSNVRSYNEINEYFSIRRNRF